MAGMPLFKAESELGLATSPVQQRTESQTLSLSRGIIENRHFSLDQIFLKVYWFLTPTNYFQVIHRF